MFGSDNAGKPVDLVVIDAFKHEGEHVEVGTVLKAVEADLASELAAAGRVRLATEEGVAAAKAIAKARQASAAAAAKASASSGPSSDAIAAAVAAGIAEGMKAIAEAQAAKA